MTPTTTRALRHGLLVLVAAVVGTVAWSIRKPVPAPMATPPADPLAGAASTRVDDLVFRRFKAEHEGFVLKAKRMVGKEGDDTNFQGVDVQISYLARGEPGKATITADACRLGPGQERAVFQGAVHVVTEDGFDLQSETLLYNANKGVVRTADPVRFKRKTLSGTATGLEYRADQGALHLPADVVLRIESETGPPTDVTADQAQASREEHELRFNGNVQVVQGRDSLRAGRLNLDLDQDLTAVYRAVAVEDVELRTSGDASLSGPSGAARAKGPRVLKSRKLELWFRDDHTLQEATASPDADLLVLPGPGEAPERQRVQAKVLAFRFDEQGRLVEMHAQRDALVSFEPLKPGKGVPRTVTAGNLKARVDPLTGEAQQIDFEKGVEFKEGGRTGRGRNARYEGARGVLVLTGDPELVDEVDRTELRAKTIEITNATGDVRAQGRVRQTRGARSLGAGAPTKGGGFLSGEEAVSVIVADRLDYVAKDRRARYEGGALLRSGQDEVRADALVLEEPSPDARRLVATGNVVSLLQPQGKPDAKTPPAPVEGKAGEMVYEAARREIVYAGAVTMRQGDIKTRSPKATLQLTEDGRDLLTLVAGEPAEIEQGKRRATGNRATYTPATETVVMVGDKVVLQDPGQQIEGRTLTFHVGDDKIVVDGQEQVRTEAVIRREPPRP